MWTSRSSLWHYELFLVLWSSGDCSPCSFWVVLLPLPGTFSYTCWPSTLLKTLKEPPTDLWSLLLLQLSNLCFSVLRTLVAMTSWTPSFVSSGQNDHWDPSGFLLPMLQSGKLTSWSSHRAHFILLPPLSGITVYTA